MNGPARFKNMSVCSSHCYNAMQDHMRPDIDHWSELSHSTRHFERNFSFSIHILLDNWVKNSRLFGSLRTSEGTNPLFSSTISSSSMTATLARWDLLDFSWLIVIAEKCCLKPLNAAVCFPNFCLKTLKDSVWFPDLLVTAIASLLVEELIHELFLLIAPHKTHGKKLRSSSWQIDNVRIFIVINNLQGQSDVYLSRIICVSLPPRDFSTYQRIFFSLSIFQFLASASAARKVELFLRAGSPSLTAS